ncbi:PhzF family phenazine biosynthesis protein [Bacillus gobiensis]|uniref:PhzF family phenazine biosynthesis protein n=1 Tax=Bacillus gobiensis TaxID=1441095 RepID=UPI003D1C7E22
MILYTVDAFTNRTFSGNPAAVCLLKEELPDSVLQSIATEMNLSETAFVIKENEGYNLRWFTPKVEVDLCGHATLSAAHVLWERNEVNEDQPITFSSLSGPLTAKKSGGWIELDFPTEAPVSCPVSTELKEAIHAPIVEAAKNRLDYIIEVENEQQVRNIAFDTEKMTALTKRGFLITSKSERPDVDFVSRCFFPTLGVLEDPVTGSAHCGLAPYWAKKLAKKEFFAEQLSERGGRLKVVLQGDRCLLKGEAITVLKGELAFPES